LQLVDSTNSRSPDETVLSDTIRLPEGLALRPECPEDHPFLESLYQSVRSDLQLLGGDSELVRNLTKLQFEAQRRCYQQMFTDASYLVIEEHSRRIGRAILDQSRGIHVVDLALIPEVRGRGIGTRLLKALQRTADKLDVPLSLSVAMDNHGARCFYLRLGFQEEQNDGIYIGLIWHSDGYSAR
jgi:GNAT superfamily N-acetyltransferase